MRWYCVRLLLGRVHRPWLICPRVAISKPLTRMSLLMVYSLVFSEEMRRGCVVRRSVVVLGRRLLRVGRGRSRGVWLRVVRGFWRFRRRGVLAGAGRSVVRAGVRVGLGAVDIAGAGCDGCGVL